MAEAVMNFKLTKPQIHSPQLTRAPYSHPKLLRQCSSTKLYRDSLHNTDGKKKRADLIKMKALPDWPLMAVIVEQIEGQKDLISHKSIWHLSDAAIKNVYTFYIMFTCWGCLFFGSTKDPFYDSEEYRKDGGDGTGFWLYEKQEDIEESNRAELWKEELREEIEQKVGSLRELEEAGRR